MRSESETDARIEEQANECSRPGAHLHRSIGTGLVREHIKFSADLLLKAAERTSHGILHGKGPWNSLMALLISSTPATPKIRTLLFAFAPRQARLKTLPYREPDGPIVRIFSQPVLPA